MWIEKIHGVGKVTAKKMHSLGLRTCADIQSSSIEQLKKWFGSSAGYYARVSRGIDERPVDSSWERKSLTVEETYHRDLHSLDECLSALPHLYLDWERRMGRGDYREKIRGYVVKVKFHDFKATTHETSSKKWPAERDFAELLKRAWERKKKPVRLLGLGVRLETEESEAEPCRPSQLELW
jgi:DNA polymerase-4